MTDPQITPATLTQLLIGAGRSVPATAVLDRVAAWMNKNGVSTPGLFELANQQDPFVHPLMSRDDVAAHNAAVSVCYAMMAGSAQTYRVAA